MHDVFREYLDDFVVYYIDDILILSKNMEDHERYVQALRNWTLRQIEKVWISSI
jgi:hypothetical protein